MTLPAAGADLSDRPLGPANTNAHNITQIAEGLAGSARPDEIVNAIFELRPSFPLTELAELLDRPDSSSVPQSWQPSSATLGVMPPQFWYVAERVAIAGGRFAGRARG